MAWTAPRTWVEGEDVVASMLNTDVRDNFKAITDPWTSYTPVLGGTGWSLGNGTATGKYTRIGKTVHFRAEIVIGSTTTKSATTSPNITVPLSIAQTAHGAQVFNCGLFDVSAALYFGLAHVSTTTWDKATIYGLYSATTFGQITAVTATDPFTWTTGDLMQMSGTYETDAA